MLSRRCNKKTELLEEARFHAVMSDCAGNLTGTHTTGAGVDVSRRTVHHRFNALDVGLKGPVRTSVRVGNLNSESNTFAADFAFCHLLHLRSRP